MNIINIQVHLHNIPIVETHQYLSSLFLTLNSSACLQFLKLLIVILPLTNFKMRSVGAGHSGNTCAQWCQKLRWEEIKRIRRAPPTYM